MPHSSESQHSVLSDPSQESVLRAIVESSGDLTAAVDQQYRFIAFNEAFRADFREVFGYNLRPGTDLREALAHLPEDRDSSVELWGRALAGEQFTVERTIGGDDQHRVYQITYSPLRDEQGQLFGAVQFVRDITARIHAQHQLSRLNAELEYRVIERTRELELTLERLREQEEQLKRSYAELQAIISSMTDGVLVYDARGNMLTMNPAARAMHDADEQAASVRQLGDLSTMLQLSDVGGIPVPLHRWPISRALQGETFAGVEMVVENRHTRRRWVGSYSGTAVRDEQGRVLQGVVTMRDVTQRKEAEHALRDSEERFRILAETVPDVVFTCDAQMQLTYINRRFQDLTGLGTTAALGLGWMGVLHPDDIERVREKVSRSVVTGRPFEAELRYRLREDGYRWFVVRAVPIRDNSRRVMEWFGTATDFNDLKQIEQTLRDREERLQAALTASGTGTFRWNIKTSEVEWDARSSRLFGLASGETIRSVDAFLAVVHPEDREAVAAYHYRCASEGADFDMEFRVVWPDGSVHWLDEKGKTFLDADGQPDYMTGACVDITHRKQVEQALRESEERYRTMGDAIPYGVWQCGPDGSVEYLSPSFLELLGMSLEEVRQQGWFHRLAPECSERVQRNWRDCIETGERWETEYRIHATNGSERVILCRGLPVRDELGRITAWVGINLDITDRKQAEQRLYELTLNLEKRVAQRTSKLERQAAQLRLLANQLTEAEQRERRQLAKTLHDGLQQMIVAAKMRVGMCKNRLTEQEMQSDWASIEQMLDQTIRASRSLAVELSPPILHDGDLSDAYEWLARWFQENHGLEVVLDIARPLPSLAENTKVFLFEAVRELLLNVVKHANVTSAHLRARGAPDRQVQVEVEDRGRGFDSHLLDRDRAQHAGFGLFSIRERLEALGGHLAAESRAGWGARFVLLAPALATTTSARARAACRAAGVDGARTELPRPNSRDDVIRILVVDDHKIVREGLIMILAGQGDFEVVGEASDGSEAIERAMTVNPDVVVMDINMPHVNGIEATRQIKLQQPEMAIVGLSLHEEQDVALAMQRAGASAYVRKDGPSEELFQAIRNACRGVKLGT